VEAIARHVDADGNGMIDVDEAKALVSAMTGFPVVAIADRHPEVVAIANKPIEVLVERLWCMTSRQNIDDYHAMVCSHIQ